MMLLMVALCCGVMPETDGEYQVVEGKQVYYALDHIYDVEKLTEALIIGEEIDKIKWVKGVSVLKPGDEVYVLSTHDFLNRYPYARCLLFKGKKSTKVYIPLPFFEYMKEIK